MKMHYTLFISIVIAIFSFTGIIVDGISSDTFLILMSISLIGFSSVIDSLHK